MYHSHKHANKERTSGLVFFSFYYFLVDVISYMVYVMRLCVCVRACVHASSVYKLQLRMYVVAHTHTHTHMQDVEFGEHENN